MIKKLIRIPTNMMDYLEGLFYQTEGYKQLIRHLSCQKNINQEALTNFTDTYEKIFIEYNMLLNSICCEFASIEMEHNYLIYPNFGLGILIATKCECED